MPINNKILHIIISSSYTYHRYHSHIPTSSPSKRLLKVLNPGIPLLQRAMDSEPCLVRHTTRSADKDGSPRTTSMKISDEIQDHAFDIWSPKQDIEAEAKARIIWREQRFLPCCGSGSRSSVQSHINVVSRKGGQKLATPNLVEKCALSGCPYEGDMFGLILVDMLRLLLLSGAVSVCSVCSGEK